MLVKVLLC